MAHNRPRRPSWINLIQWARFAYSWEHRAQIDRDIFRFTRYQNKVIPGLYLNVAQAHVDSSSIYGVWCNLSQSQYWLNDGDVPNFYGYNYAKFTPQAQEVVRAKIAEWDKVVDPEPPPEPPEPPPPPPGEDEIDDGNGILARIWDSLTDWIHQAILAGLAFLEEPLNIIRGIIGSLAQTISGIVSAVSSAIQTVMVKIVGMFDTVVQKIKGVIDRVWSHIEQIWLTLKDMFATVKTAIVTAFKTSWVFIKETFTVLWGKIKNGLTYIGNAILDGLKYLWDKIKDALNWTWKILKGAYTAIVETATAVWNRTKEKLTETIASIKVAFGDFVDRLIEWWESYMAWRDKNTENLQNWTEEKMVDAIKFMLKAQRTVLDELAGGS